MVFQKSENKVIRCETWTIGGIIQNIQNKTG